LAALPRLANYIKNFPVPDAKFPVMAEKFPAKFSRELRQKRLKLWTICARLKRSPGQTHKIPGLLAQAPQTGAETGK
jgi:hypothetical protein